MKLSVDFVTILALETSCESSARIMKAINVKISGETAIADGHTHTPVDILEGHNDTALKEWLRNNKQVTTVTRDRTSAYAKTLEEILPGCTQIADRFHLHRNLPETVKTQSMHQFRWI